MKREFSLVEIIVSILIILVLISVSFIGYLLLRKDSRNATRLADLNNIIKSIELYSSNAGFMPKPTSGVSITYLSGTIWTQGTVGNSVISKLTDDLEDNIVDPLTKEEYTYSLLNNNKEYQIKAIYEPEEENVFSLPINKIFAFKENYSLIKGNFNGRLASLNKNNIIYILSIPSIVIGDINETSLIEIVQNKKYAYDYKEGYNGFIPEKLELLSGSLEDLKDLSNKTIFLSNYKESYKNLKNKDKNLEKLDKFNITLDNYDSDMDDIANDLLLSTVKEIPNIDFFEINQKRFVIDNFNLDKVYEETWDENRNFQDRWWINSGAFFYVKDGKGSTIQGELEKGTKWQDSYSKYNGGLETDLGYHPQNIFRLILNKKFKNFNQYVYFKINKYILSESEHRYESNGFLLFNRYVDSDNLYYAGIRVDGSVVIKKKYKGEYYTLAYSKIFDGEYDREKNPNLIPINKWIGIKTEVLNYGTDRVSIKLYIDTNNDGKWTFALGTIDDLKSSGEKVINSSSYAGVRTDFMDVEIDKYYIKEI